MGILRVRIEVLKIVWKYVDKIVFASYRLLSFDVLIIDAVIAHNDK